MSNSKSDWVNVNEPFSSFKGVWDADLETGTYLHIRDRNNKDEYYLVGDINNVNGICADCRGIKADSIVVRYKMIELPKD